MPTTTNTGPTLTNVTYMGRQAVKFGAIALVVMIVGRMVVGAAINYWKATHPPPPPPPTVGFGILPALEFPPQTETSIPEEYRLETATGGFPDFGDRAKVFLMPQPAPSLLADQRAKEIAAQLDFVFEPETLDSRTYRWTKSQPLNSTLELDIVNNHFSLTTDYLSRPELLQSNQLPGNFEAVKQVKAFIERAELMPADVATAAGEVVYLKSLGGDLIEAVSLSDADFIQVDLNRTTIDGMRMFSPQGYQGVISAIIVGSNQQQGNIVQMEYYYNPIDYIQVHTYPIRTPQNAWQLLQAGEGYVVQSDDVSTVVVRSVQLGYYDSFAEQEYLQPVYVFEGDDGFIGYVPAIDPKYTQNNL